MNDRINFLLKCIQSREPPRNASHDPGKQYPDQKTCESASHQQQKHCSHLAVKSKRKQDDSAAPFNRGSLFFPEVYCPPDSPGPGCNAFCHYFIFRLKKIKRRRRRPGFKVQFFPCLGMNKGKASGTKCHGPDTHSSDSRNRRGRRPTIKEGGASLQDSGDGSHLVGG